MDESISLAETVKGIAGCLEIPPEYGLVDEWDKFSSAARLLNMALHHSETCPRWLDYDPKRQFSVFSDSASTEGIDILTAATDLSKEKATSRMEYGMPLSWWEEPMRPHHLGFLLFEIIEFLDKNQIKHNLIERSQTSTTPRQNPRVSPEIMANDYDGVTGRKALCKEFGLRGDSFNSVVNRVKKAGFEFDRLGRIPRLKHAVIGELKALDRENNTKKKI